MAEQSYNQDREAQQGYQEAEDYYSAQPRAAAVQSRWRNGQNAAVSGDQVDEAIECLGTGRQPSVHFNCMPGKKARKKSTTAVLKGWTAIASFLSIPVSTAHRWARDGMPIRREGRFTVAGPDELRAWLGRESHMSGPAEILTDKADVAGALKESLAALRRGKRRG